MYPTRAPWAPGEPKEIEARAIDPNAASGHRPHGGLHTGIPVQPFIIAHPALPVPNPSAWPKTWEPAKKIIKSSADVTRALKGSTLHSFVAFTMALNESIVGVKNTEPCTVNRPVRKILDALEKLAQFIKEIPPATHEVRYGNPAYREWFDRMMDSAPELVYDILGDELGEATVELIPYFIDSFGNRSRIDYGTGHETTFVAFLYCLFCLGVLKEVDCQAVLLKVFNAYLALMREVQTTYWCAPDSCLCISVCASAIAVEVDRL
jgi:serine/threonine-protein phosphatase 2A activator